MTHYLPIILAAALAITVASSTAYHVVPGNVLAKDVVRLHSAKTAEGQGITIKTVNGGLMLDGAHVTKTDIVTSNGVIHVIDSVLLPK